MFKAIFPSRLKSLDKMSFKTILFSAENGVATLKVNRLEAMNALNTVFFKELDNVLDEVKKDESIRILVLAGEGKAFVAGADIAEMQHKTQKQGAEFSMKGQKTMLKMSELPIPVIAAVNGYCLGGGLELAMACDFRIAGSKAKFSAPEVNLGLIPGFAGTQRLPRLVGLSDAMYLLMSAEMIDAGEAKNIGLVQKVVEQEKLMEEVNAICQNILSKGPQAIKLIKKVCKEGLQISFEKGCALEAEHFGSLFEGEGLEGMSAFLEKRKANW